MLAIRGKVTEAVNKIRSLWSGVPQAGVILGTGLGGLTQNMEVEAVIPYHEIPHFAVSTATTHSGNLVCGTLNGMSVLAMEGRIHAYEGYSYQQITFPVRVMKALGADLLIVSNAAGGLNPQFRQGDLVVMEDHINLMNGNPLVGVNDEQLGERFPDMCAPYTPELIDRAMKIALDHGFVAHRGVYVALVGPNLETRAEYRFLRMIGADIVGMSTVPEVLVAVHSGMRVLGLSIITDICLPDALKPADIAEIISVANEAEPKLSKIVLEILKQESQKS
ncbi:MAG: purine-nucleoside phosphorylase [Planctomycetia bacterium]|nr:purine-nucleoside phosphorylase [Planctomycetia bacterium]